MSVDYPRQKIEYVTHSNRTSTITAKETAGTRGSYQGEVNFANDGIPRKYTVTYYGITEDEAEAAGREPGFDTTRSIIRVKDYAGWRKRKDAPSIRRAILDASPVARAHFSGRISDDDLPPVTTPHTDEAIPF